MPEKGWKTATLRESTYKALEKYRETQELDSQDQAVHRLLEKAEAN